MSKKTNNFNELQVVNTYSNIMKIEIISSSPIDIKSGIMSVETFINYLKNLNPNTKLSVIYPDNSNTDSFINPNTNISVMAQNSTSITYPQRNPIPLSDFPPTPVTRTLPDNNL